MTDNPIELKLVTPLTHNCCGNCIHLRRTEREYTSFPTTMYEVFDCAKDVYGAYFRDVDYDIPDNRLEQWLYVCDLHERKTE